MSDAVGSKNTLKIQSKIVDSKKLFFDCVRKPDLGFSRKRPFSADKSDCIGNGLKALFCPIRRRIIIKIKIHTWYQVYY